MLFTLLPTILQLSKTWESTKPIGHFYFIFLWLAPLQKAGIDSDTHLAPNLKHRFLCQTSIKCVLLPIAPGTWRFWECEEDPAWLFGRRKDTWRKRPVRDEYSSVLKWQWQNDKRHRAGRREVSCVRGDFTEMTWRVVFITVLLL